MVLEVRLFAMLKEAEKADRIRVRVPSGASVATLRSAIAAEFPALAPLLPSSRLAANLHFVGDDHILAEGQELALIPPVSGG